MGKDALNEHTGDSNVAVGHEALLTNSTADNTAVGYQAGRTTATGQVIQGQQAGYATVGDVMLWEDLLVTPRALHRLNRTPLLAVSQVGMLHQIAKNTILGAYDGNQGNLTSAHQTTA